MQSSLASGKFEFQLQGASLTRDVKLLGSMNPYVVLKLGEVKKTSAVNQSGGKTPRWCDKMEFHRTNESILNIEVYNMRKLGLFDNDLICTGSLDLCKFQTPFSIEEKIPLIHGNSAAGQLFMKVTFTPDIQITYQQGYIVQQGEAPLDLTLRVVSALLTRDTQWFGSMTSYYVMSCGDRKFTSAVCNGGKSPQWGDKFKIVKKHDQKLTIDIQNQNNKTNIAYCQVPHNILANFQAGVRTLPLTFEGSPAGQLFLEVVYNSYPQDCVGAPVYTPLPDTCNMYPPQQPTNPQYPPVMNPQFPPNDGCPVYVDNCAVYSDTCAQYPPQQQNVYPPQPIQNQYPPQPIQNQYPPQPQQNQYPVQPQQNQYPVQPQQNVYPPQQQNNYPPVQQNNYPPQQIEQPPIQNGNNPYGIYPNLGSQIPQQQQQNNNQYNGFYSPPPAFG